MIVGGVGLSAARKDFRSRLWSTSIAIAVGSSVGESRRLSSVDSVGEIRTSGGSEGIAMWVG